MININKFYVYEWIRLDTNEPFYVGKGCGNRWCNLKRDNNTRFNRIVNSKKVAVTILEDNLDEETAYEYEIFYIWLYRDIIGYDMCNYADGGENPPTLFGNKNGNYHNYWTKEQKDRARKNMLNRYDGAKNPNAKKIMCLENGKIYNCILDAFNDKENKINTYSSLTIALSDSKRMAGNKHWIFFNKDNEKYKNDSLRIRYLIELMMKTRYKYYIDTNTNIIYNKSYLIKKFKKRIENILKNNKNLMLISEYYNSRFVQ